MDEGIDGPVELRSARRFLAVCIELFAVGSAVAGCTLASDVTAVRRSLNSLSRCNDRRLRSGTEATCTIEPPPACAGTLVTDAVALGYGSLNPPASAVDTRALRDQLSCQKNVGRGILGYVNKKLSAAIKHQDPVAAESAARKRLERITKRCLVEVAEDTTSSLLVPRVGAQCAAAVGDDGTAVNAFIAETVGCRWVATWNTQIKTRC